MTQTPAETARAVLITGPSGAGRSTALNALEDFGYEAIDNLPLSLLGQVVPQGGGNRVALGLDARNRDFSVDGLLAARDRLAARADLGVDLLYLDARPDILLRRFSETRRRHPLAQEGLAATGIAREAELLAPLMAASDLLIDTSELTPHDLRAQLERMFGAEDGIGLSVSLQSFSYKRGMPPGLDLVFDMRFLRNPYWEPALRAFDGRDPRVAEYMAGDPRHGEALAKMTDLLLTLLPGYRDEGKTHLGIGIGCTGGQHRSVAVAEELATRLNGEGWRISVRHREIERRAEAARAVPQDAVPQDGAAPAGTEGAA